MASTPQHDCPLRLDDFGSLVERTDLRLVAALAEPRPEARDALRVRLVAMAGVGGVAALFDGEGAAAAALARAGARVRCDVFAEEQLAAALAQKPRWLEVEPLASVEALGSLVAKAQRAGVRVLFDERRTFGRAAAGFVAARVQPRPDAVLVSTALAPGASFAAVVGDVEPADGAGDAAVQTALAVCELLRVEPRHAAFAGLGRELAAALSAAAERQELAMTCRGPEAMPEVRFADQEGAPADLILHHFGLEAAAAGVMVHGPLLLPAAALQRGIGNFVAPLGFALARIRTLLIEYNSYLSGGLPFVWPGGDERLRARGAARYRYPRLGEVDVDPVGAAIRIAFLPHDLGPVTSSGFYLPTRLTGDVDVAVRFGLRRFDSGPDATCLGLFLQNEASSARYYAQVMSTADAPQARSAALGHAGRVIGRMGFDADHGWLRLRRADGEVTAFFRLDARDAWQRLGSVPAVADELIVGAKIWSKVRTDGLVADLFDLEVAAELAADQPPLLAERADPRDPAKRPRS